MALTVKIPDRENHKTDDSRQKCADGQDESSQLSAGGFDLKQQDRAGPEEPHAHRADDGNDKAHQGDEDQEESLPAGEDRLQQRRQDQDRAGAERGQVREDIVEEFIGFFVGLSPDRVPQALLGRNHRVLFHFGRLSAHTLTT